MKFTETEIQGSWLITPIVHSDDRGEFVEIWRESQLFEFLGREFTVRQVSQSRSHKGVIRGVHYTGGPIGQAKLISCTKGSVWDVVVDLRPESKTYGKWSAEILSPTNGKMVFISEGLGHAFLALEDDTVISYLGSQEFDPKLDMGLYPLDKVLGISFDDVAKSFGISKFKLSEKDRSAPPFQVK